MNNTIGRGIGYAILALRDQMAAGLAHRISETLTDQALHNEQIGTRDDFLGLADSSHLKAQKLLDRE